MRPFAFLALLTVACTAPNSGTSDVDLAGVDAGEIPPDLAGVDLANPPDLVALADLAPLCVATLANVGAGDFTVRFRIQTTATKLSSVLNQRWSCDPLHDFFDVQMNPLGILLVELYGGGQGSEVDSTLPVNSGTPHDVVAQRRAGVMSITIDQFAAGSGMTKGPLGALPALGVGKGDPCEQYNSVPLDGKITDVCLSIP